MILRQIKYFFLFLLVFLLGGKMSYAKTEVVLPQNQVSFSTENTQSFTSLEKELQPNIGFLKEKCTFVISESVSAQNQHEFSEHFVGNVANAVDDFVEGVVNGVRRYDISGEIANGVTTITRQLNNNGNTITLKWMVDSKGKISFGNRSLLADILGTVDDEAHHILTWTKSGKHSIVQIAARDGFHLNIFENGVGLSKYRRSLAEGMHGNHPAYDDYVVHRLTQYKELYPNPTPQQANEFIQKTLIPEMRQLIRQADQSDYNLNEYFKQVINPSIGTLLTE